MKRVRSLFGLFAPFLFISLPSANAQVNILSERYDNSRTGANLNETVLNTSNVNTTQFGLLYQYPVDGSLQAQPLYVANLAIPGQGTRNVLFVVTMNDVVYAFDADSVSSNGGVLWSVDFRNPAAGITPIPITDIVGVNNMNIAGNVGIESTPVIDLSTNTMYLVARTKEVSGNTTNYVPRLHALDITTGAEKFGGPVVIQASVPGSGQGSANGTLVFDPRIQNQRTSLVLANGQVLIAWGSHEDLYAWHGWVMAYNAQTLAQSSVFCTTPNGMQGGVWTSGRAPVVDASGNVYYPTGNGDWDGVSSFSDSLIKLSTTGGNLTLKDWFTPDNYSSLQSSDLDLGSSAPLLIPGTNLILDGGKDSTFYVMNLSNLGHEQTGNNQIVQHFSAGGAIRGGPVFWNRTTGAGPTMYVWPDNTTLQAYQFGGSTFNVNPISQSSITAPSGKSGGVLTLSANGSTTGTGIVWSSMPLSQDGDHGTVTGVLRAFDANNLTTELWDSQMNSTRDAMGFWPKFSLPTVDNGKVYMASFSGFLSVYGLFSSQDFALTPVPSSVSVARGAAAYYTVNTTALNGFSGTISLSASGLPAGATASFSPSSVATGSSVTLTVTTSASTPAGSYAVAITGTSGSLTHTVTVTLSVTSASDFTLSATPSLQTVTPAGGVSYTVNASGFSGGSISLSVSGLPRGATALFNPASVATGASSTLTVNTAASTPVGNSVLNIIGTSGSVTHTTVVTLNVASSGATGNVISIDFVGSDVSMAASEVAGVVPKANWNNASGASSSSALGLVDETGSATTATVTWSSYQAWVTPITDQAGNYRMMKGYLDTNDATATTVSVTGLPSNGAGYNVYVYADGDNGGVTRTGSYQISGTGITTTSISLTDGAGVNFSGTYTQANNSVGNYVVFTIPNVSGFTITATPGASSDTHPRAPVNGLQIVPLAASPDFTVTGTPSSQTVVAGGSTTYTVTTGAVNGFSGTVGLSVSGLPSGATGTFNPTSVTAGSSSTLTVTTSSSTTVGSYTVTITGTNGTLTHTATVTLGVSSSGSTGKAISIDFVGSDVPMATSEVAGVVPKANWNNASGASSSSALGLVDETGSATTVTVTWSSYAAWVTPITDQAGNYRMMKGYLDTSDTSTTTVTVSGVAPNASGYTIYVYADGDNGGVTRTGSYQISGPGITTTSINLTDGAGVNFSGTYTQANNSVGNYVVFTIPNVSGFTITATPGASSDTHPRAPVNGLQIVPLAASPDFTVTGTPGTQTVVAGGSTTYTVNTGVLSGFSGTIGLSVSGLPSGTTGTFNPTSVTAGGSSTLTVTTAGSTPVGSSTLTITGTSGSLTHTSTVTLSVTAQPDFTMSGTPSTQTVMAGGSTTYTVNTTGLNGFSGTIGLSVSGLPSGATGTFNPTSVTAGGGSTLTVTTAGSTPVGSSTLTITGTSGSLTHTSAVTLSVTDFTMTGTPSTQTVVAGRSTTYTVNTTGLNGFTGTIGLSVSGLPSGATGTFNPTSVTAGGSSTLTVTTAGSTPVGSSTLTITGTSGSLTHTSTVTLSVTAQPDFTMSGTPSTQTVVAGGSTTYTVNTGALNGFTGTIGLSVSGLPSGATGTFNPTSVTAGSSSTLTVTTSSSTAVGSYTVTITGTNGTLTHTATVTLGVSSSGSTGKAISIDFVGSDVPMAASEVAGVVPKANWNDASGASSSSALGLVDETGSATTATVTWSSYQAWGTPITDQAGDHRMMKGYLDTNDATTTTVSVTGLPSNGAGYNVYVYADGDNGGVTRTGSYQISGTGITTTSISLTDGAGVNFSGTYTQANNSAGNYVVFTIPNVSGFTITATPGASSDTHPRAPVNGFQIVPISPDFTVTGTPSSQTVVAGGSTTYTVNTGVLSGFSGTIGLSVSGLPSGATGTFNPTSVTAGSNSTLTVTTSSSTAVGSYTVTITGTSGTLTHTARVTLGVSPTAKAISIDFVGSDVPMAASELAGVVPKPNWNNASGASSSSALGLVDETGSATMATATWLSYAAWGTPITDQAGNYRMMKGYLDTSDTSTTTVTVSGLAPDASGYTIYVYADGDNGGVTRTGSYRISGPGITTTSINLTDGAGVNFSGTYTQANNSAGNYVVFTIPNVSGFTITATPGASSDTHPRAPVNGIQIVTN